MVLIAVEHHGRNARKIRQIVADRCPASRLEGRSTGYASRLATTKRRHTDRQMIWSMKKIGAYKNRGALVMALVLSYQLLTGTGLFCAIQIPHPPLSLANHQTALPGSTADREDSSGSAGINAGDSQGRTLPCSCKKHKKCPAIPRAIITSNPTHWFSEFPHQAKSDCYDALVPHAMEHRIAAKGGPPLMKLAWCAPFFCSNPLALTSVLLI